MGDGVKDIARLQRDLIQKASAKKFNPTLSKETINLVAIDVSELQLRTVDIADCLLAASGNAMVIQYSNQLCTRADVVGVFENPEQMTLSCSQKKWLEDVQKIAHSEPHPRTYIHGALFLFRKPSKPAAICYELKQVIVWNNTLVTHEQRATICAALNNVIPFAGCQ